jgi:ribosomal protein S18 acetylase RimI-like enzyme
MLPLLAADHKAPPSIIRQLKESDGVAVQEIFIATFLRENDEDFYESWKSRYRRFSLGLFYKATLIGFGIVCRDGRLAYLAMRSDARGGGAGTRLLAETVRRWTDRRPFTSKYSRCMYLIPVKNPKVIAWYERHGFQVQDDPSRTYKSDEAHFIMRLGDHQNNDLTLSILR